MEALNFLKFWKPTIPFPTPVIELRNDVVLGEEREEEEEDSFFDLVITSPKFGSSLTKNDTFCSQTQSSNDNDNDETKTTTPTKQAYPKPSLIPLSPIDSIPKRKVLPLEPPLKPQSSPIALLKSAPNFRAFSFKKSKSTEKARESARRFNAAMESPRSSKQPERLTSKDVIQKYLKLVKPLYVKVSRRYVNEKSNGGSALFTASPSSSPGVFAASPKDRNIPSGIRDVCKQLGKSKSTTTSTSTSSSLPSFNAAQTTSFSYSRRDDSLLQQHDGIQSAILHCKRSFNSSRDSSSLSRSTSDSSSIKSCSTDSYRISHDYSARNSIEDGRSSFH